MNRRQRIGVGAALLVVGANVAVWYARREPDKAPPDTRGLIRGQMTASWESLPTAPLGEATGSIRGVLGAPAESPAERDTMGFGTMVSFNALTDAQRDDLVDAIGDLVSAIAANEARPLINFMKDRGMKLAPRALKERLPNAGGPEPAQRLEAAFAMRSAPTHWSAIVPEATDVHVWRPASLRHVSMMHLGRSAAWAWGNEALVLSLFVANPTYEQSSRERAAVLADARVLIEHDDTLDAERSPYFFRFWLSPDDNRWRPIAAKLVRTVDPAEAAAHPGLLF